MNIVPQHKGLGVPPGNPYFNSNPVVVAKQHQEGAQAQGLGHIQEGATPPQAPAEQLAEGIIKGQVGQEQLQGLVQSGEIDIAVAEAAMGMAQQFLQADQAGQQGPEAFNSTYLV